MRCRAWWPCGRTRAEPALAREHEDRLREWVRAARAAMRAALGAEAVQALVGFGLATWLLADHFARTGAHDAGAGLLAVYWALSLPMLGYELALYVQQVPAQRSLTLRVVEPLGAPEERDDGDPALTRSGAAALADARRACRCTCRTCVWSRRGTQILDVAALAIAPGEHVAIVGASGAGKSSLVGLLLGWHRPRVGDGHHRRPRAAASRSSRRCGSGRCGSIRPCTCGTDRCTRTSATAWPRAGPGSRARDRRSRSRGDRDAPAAGRARRRRWARRVACSRAARDRGCASAAGCCARHPRAGDPRRAVPRPGARAARRRCWRARAGAGRTRRCCA